MRKVVNRWHFRPPNTDGKSVAGNAILVYVMHLDKKYTCKFQLQSRQVLVGHACEEKQIYIHPAVIFKL